MHQSSYQAMSDIVNRLPLPENAKMRFLLEGFENMGSLINMK